MNHTKTQTVWALLRISLGLLLFWAFLDKLFGLGFATCRDATSGLVETGCAKAWLYGGSPTAGFLKAAVKGSLAGFYHALSGSVLIDWLFMGGLFLTGLAFILGIGIKIAGFSGALLMILMYSALSLPPANHPFLDEHIIYALVMLGFVFSRAGHRFGFGRWWSRTALVKRFSFLE